MRVHLILAALVAALFALSLATGPAGFAPIWDRSGPMPLILWEIRLPRAILALVIGAGLGLAGAAMQGFLRNPLAEPGVLGISGMAALGAVLAIHLGLAMVWPLPLPEETPPPPLPPPPTPTI